jgi:hypothetical protein
MTKADNVMNYKDVLTDTILYTRFIKYIYGFSVLLLDLGRFFSFLILYTVGRIPWAGDQHVARPLPTQRTTKAQNKRTQTSMS